MPWARTPTTGERFAAAARLWGEALDDDPSLAESRQTQHPYNASCCAALAAAGQGQNEPPLNDEAKATLRAQALAWLQSELAIWTQLLDSANEEQRTAIAQTLAHWQQDLDVASLRGDAIDSLPESERPAWKQLWSDVAALLARAGEASPADTTRDHPRLISAKPRTDHGVRWADLTEGWLSVSDLCRWGENGDRALNPWFTVALGQCRIDSAIRLRSCSVPVRFLFSGPTLNNPRRRHFDRRPVELTEANPGRLRPKEREQPLLTRGARDARRPRVWSRNGAAEGDPREYVRVAHDVRRRDSHRGQAPQTLAIPGNNSPISPPAETKPRGRVISLLRGSSGANSFRIGDCGVMSLPELPLLRSR